MLKTSQTHAGIISHLDPMPSQNEEVDLLSFLLHTVDLNLVLLIKAHIDIFMFLVGGGHK